MGIDYKGQKLYFILPVFNEEKNIQRQLLSIHNFAKNNGYAYKILIVDDGSKDRSSEVARSMRPDIQLEILRHDFNKGPGGAFKTAFFHLEPDLDSEDIVVTLESDNTQNINLIKKMIDRINRGLDVVVGSIFINGGCAKDINKKRYYLTYYCNKLYSLLFPIKNITTYTGFLRVYRGGAIKKILVLYGENTITNYGFGGMAEFLLKLRSLDLLMEEEPMIILCDKKLRKSKLKVLPTIIEHLKLIAINFFKKPIPK